MKTGIVTFHFVNNFGAALQTYALRKTLEEKCGTEAKLIDYRHWFIRFTDTVRLFPVTTNKKEIISGIKTMIPRLKRLAKFSKFHKEYFNMTKKYLLVKKLRKNPPKFDKYICGSDQIWNPIVTMGVAEPYFLGFVKDKNKKISYAPSFGITNIKEKAEKKMAKYLDNFSALSIREKEGVDIIKNMTGKTPEHLIDPTFLLDREKWHDLSGERIIKDNYIVLYIMQRNEKIYDYVKKIKDELGLKVVEISRYGYKPDFIDESLVDVGPKEFVNLIENSSFVVTNSFHGLAFSIIFEKNFYLIPTNKFNSRLENLLNIFGIDKCRDITKEELLRPKYDKENLEKRIGEEQEKSYNYLIKNISENKNVSKSISIKNKTECCGCEACKQVCPKNCIIMKEDKEGFLYPKVEKSKCIDCGLCREICPVLNKKGTETGFEPIAIGGWNKNEDVRKNSSSGGAFSVFAEKIINEGGIVYGCALDENMKAVHIGVENISDLYKLYGSKYVQSKIGDCYNEVKNNLTAGRKVLFVGTPCQAAGLKSFLKKDYDNLYVIDFICHGVPSPMVFRKYIEYLEKKYKSRVVEFKFRNKDKKWSSTGQQKGTKVKFENGKIIKMMPAYKDMFMNGFLDNLYLRPSCHKCSFKNVPKNYSDFTIADFWGVDKVDKTLNDGNGTSLIIINTIKGKKVFDDTKSNFIYKEIPYEKAVKRNLSIIKSAEISKNRNKFFNTFDRKPFYFTSMRYMNGFVWAEHKFFDILKKKFRRH